MPPDQSASLRFPVSADDPEYLRLSSLEAKFWSARNAGFLESVEQAGEALFDRYTNRRFTGDESTYWYETIAARGPFRRGLALGTAALGQDGRILESNPELHLTFCDIAGGSLRRWQRVLERRFPGRVDTRVVDLNFVELEQDAYDVIISSSTMHHVVNLERVAEQINRALASGGLFFLQDYVGESRYNFDPRRKCIFEAIYNRDVARRPGQRPGLVWSNDDKSQFSPFCGIRSGDILRVMADHLDPVEEHCSGAIVALMLYARPIDLPAALRPSWFSRSLLRVKHRLSRLLHTRPREGQSALIDPDFERELEQVDEIISDTGVLSPLNAFAVYRKR